MAGLLAGCSTGDSHYDCGAVEPRLSGLYYETSAGKTFVSQKALAEAWGVGRGESRTPDGRVVTITLLHEAHDVALSLSAKPSDGIQKWGFDVAAEPEEYFTGLMERVVDGPQQESWRSGIQENLNLRGQKVDMILKPTMSVYAPYYLSSRGYALFVQDYLPGEFDFCVSDPDQVKVAFEGETFSAKIYKGNNPAELVRAHALDAGPPFLPPKWMYSPWRWRDEINTRATYYDGTPVAGPFNSEFMEDVLLMRAYGIPCGVYWVDRPWGPGPNGYDDFKIDTHRLPHFAESVEWLNSQNIRMVMWIGPFFQGDMATKALAKGYTLPGQSPSENNYPLVDFTNPEAKKYWQDGVARLLAMGVAGFKLDRSEEDIPESGPYRVHNGWSVRENRNAYPALYVKAAYDIAKKYRGNDFFCMPRAAYTGSSAYGVFWGGDIGGCQEGLRAEIIGVQRAAVMGYPNWGSDTGGYSGQKMETEVVGRWLEFSCFTPIMEVGPTKNVGFWNYHNPASYDTNLIAIWRFYARLHNRLADYSFASANEASETGMPIVRPLFLVDPTRPAAWSNWWTYCYGRDIVVSPIWQKEQRTQQVYLPSGEDWRDAWNPAKTYVGGQIINVEAPLHHLPIFVRVGSNLDLGDLNREWEESLAIAQTPPNLKALDAGVSEWYANQYPVVVPIH